VEHLFVDTISVQRMDPIPDGMLGYEKPYKAVSGLEAVSCWIAMHEGLDTVEMFGSSDNTSYEMTTTTEDIVLEDKIIRGTEEFIVKQVTEAKTPYGVHHFVFQLEKLK
jgi:hypothetical protein